MPLPPALAARLKRRGILPQASESRENAPECEEEVIAEDYDEPGNKTTSSTTFSGKKLKTPVAGCPNKYNIYHDCSDYCHKRWGNGKENPSPAMQRKLQKLLKKYPLPEEWQHIWDPGVATYYFWNIHTDEVSWLPPDHPKASVSLSASKLRAMMKEGEDHEEQSASEESGDESKSDDDSDMSSISESPSDSDSEKEKPKKPRISSPPRKQQSYFRDSKDRRGRDRVKRNDLDPMDPAAYSDTCPRGKWSDGLDQQGEANSGADPTAPGPLFQMRPYPNPGSVLRMNKQLKNDT